MAHGVAEVLTVAARSRDSSGERPAFSLLALIKEMDRRHEQRFEMMDKATASALASAKEAMIKAETAAEKRFEGLNELRGVVNDVLGKTMPRSEFEVDHQAIREKLDQHSTHDELLHKDLTERLASLDKKIDNVAARDLGHKDTTATIRANVAVAVSLALLLLTLFSWISHVMPPK